MSINSHLSTCVGTQSPKYLEMAQGHISLSEPWRAPPEQAAHQIECRLTLQAVGMAKRSHGVGGGAGVEQESANAKGHRELEGERAQSIGRECERVTTARGGEPFFQETRVLAQGNPSACPSIAAGDHERRTPRSRQPSL
jgi:hypothetical protein